MRSALHRFCQHSTAASLLAFALGGPHQALAQREPPRTPRTVFVGGNLIYAQPQGDFRNYVSQAWGAAGHLIFALDPQGIVALRTEFGYLTYGQRTARQALGGGALGLIKVDVTTSNNIVIGGIGVQVMAPTGALRPYISGTAGFSYFFTESSVEGSNSSQSSPFASTENFSDGGFSASYGGGFYIPIRKLPLPVSLDIGAQMHRNADVQYLTKNSITFRGANSPPTITAVRSAADYLTFRLGASVGVR